MLRADDRDRGDRDRSFSRRAMSTAVVGWRSDLRSSNKMRGVFTCRGPPGALRGFADEEAMAKPIFDDESWSCSGIGSKTGPHFTDRARPGSKLHLVTEAQGIPLALILIGASRNGVTQPLPLIEANAPIRGKRDGRCPSRSSCRPIVATITTNSKPLHAAGIAAQSARRGEPHGSGLSIRPGGRRAQLRMAA